ncbi:MAG: hypothetical protein K2I19_03985 [Muribaculaceae bacterium]|nr:hypothetical protein [Muribaculaceae bacterium]
MKLYTMPLLAASLLALASCGGNADKADEAGRELFEQASKALDDNNYEQARLLLDSLDSSCKESVALRREAMPLRAKAIEGLSMQLIPQADEAIANAMMQIDRLGKEMADAGDKSDPYVVPKAWPKRGDIKAEGVEPRVDRKGFFRLIVKSPGKVIDLNSVELSGADNSSVSTTPLPSDRVAKVEGMELMSLSQEEFAPVAEWLATHQGAQLSLSLVGAKGRKDIKITADQASMLLAAWQYSRACQELVEIQVERERLERQLKIARDQLARIGN